jgi:glycosyltransferase involved in cell wall biosynthesis
MLRLSKLLSIAICTKDRQESLIRLIRDLIRQQKINRVKVKLIIIDSSINSDLIYKLAEIKHDRKFGSYFEYIYHRIEATGISFARNKAIELTNSKYIWFMDDDITPGDDLLKIAISKLNKYETIEILYGVICPKTVMGKPLPAILKLVSAHTPWILTANHQSNKPSAYTANSIVRLDVFARIGCFNTVFANMNRRHYHPYGEDPELFQRAKEQGIKLSFCRNMSVFHQINYDRSKLTYIAWRYYDDAKNTVLFNFYSKYYDYSLRYFIVCNLIQLKNTAMKSISFPYFGMVYFFAELTGQFIMVIILLMNFEYYRKSKIY